MLSLMCIARESACDQHKANQHCQDRVQGFCILTEKTPTTSINQCSAEH
ncbi:unnamed protein product [Staurois parvus]|uniref:Uncharacterized protein n=1 Tax=Staurois parvus TaxID=386267 RepID=A0ABN9EX46_9NEOB|nr:unnamed protein product [Staurois parvus]